MSAPLPPKKKRLRLGSVPPSPTPSWPDEDLLRDQLDEGWSMTEADYVSFKEKMEVELSEDEPSDLEEEQQPVA